MSFPCTRKVDGPNSDVADRDTAVGRFAPELVLRFQVIVRP